MWVAVDYSKLEQLDEIKDKLPGDTWVIRKTYLDGAVQHRDFYPHPTGKIIGCHIVVGSAEHKWPQETAQTAVDRISQALKAEIVNAIQNTKQPGRLSVRVELTEIPY